MAGSLPIWIDALCINQQDVLERGHQVDMMGVIYRGAQRVIAWLGTPDLEELESAALDVKQRHPQKVPVPDLRFIQRAAESNLSRVVSGRSGVSEWARNIFLVPTARKESDVRWRCVATSTGTDSGLPKRFLSLVLFVFSAAGNLWTVNTFVTFREQYNTSASGLVIIPNILTPPPFRCHVRSSRSIGAVRGSFRTSCDRMSISLAGS